MKTKEKELITSSKRAILLIVSVLESAAQEK